MTFDKIEAGAVVATYDKTATIGDMQINLSAMAKTQAGLDWLAERGIVKRETPTFNTISQYVDYAADPTVTDGQSFYAVAEYSAEQVKQREIDAAKAKAYEAKMHVRERIRNEVGDTESILGVVGDATAVLVQLGTASIVALSQSNDFAAYKTSLLGVIGQLVGGDPTAIVKKAGALLQDVGSGKTQLPHTKKQGGTLAVFDDTERVAKGIAAILEEEQGSY